jgi:beta-lactamase class D
MTRIVTFLAALLVSATSAAGPVHKPLVLADFTQVPSTCIAVYDTEADQYLVHNLAQCQERLAPCSTFKIPNALIGLETGVLDGPGDLKKWDGATHSRKVLNQDHDLASAIRDSVLWYFQDVALDIGPERMQQYLAAFDYGNQDISGGQDRFWLSSSLEITAMEQIRFMAALDSETLPAGVGHQQAVKTMMRQDERLPEGFEGELYGKTGSCIGKPVHHGWFTGFYHRDGRRYVFAVNVKGEKQYGWRAREIAVSVLNELP